MSDSLKQYFSSAKISKAAFARKWEINLVMLYRYLKGSATPSTEVLAKLVPVPNFELRFAGRILKPQDIPLKSPTSEKTNLQLELDFDQPLNVRLGAQDLSIGVVLRPDGRLEIKLDLTSAA